MAVLLLLILLPSAVLACEECNHWTDSHFLREIKLQTGALLVILGISFFYYAIRGILTCRRKES